MSLQGRSFLALLIACTSALCQAEALLFDGVDADGRRLLMRSELAGPPERIGAGIEGRRPRLRPGDGAIAYHSIATDLEPARLMLVGDVRRGAVPREISLDRWVQEREIAWSPDGRHIAFFSQHHEAAGDIFVAEVGAAGLLGVRNLTAPSGGARMIEPDVTPDWSPDGLHIALTSYRGTVPAIWVFDADGTRARQLTRGAGFGDYFPAWSPDAKLVAFQRNDPGHARIGLVAATGGEPMFVDLPGDAYQPAFAPDGQRLAVAITFPDGERDLAVIALDGRVLDRIAHPGDDQNPHWIVAPPQRDCARDRACLRLDPIRGAPSRPALAPSRPER